MKVIGKILKTLLVLALILAVVFAAGRYGWKLLGFRACSDAGIESVQVSENAVYMKGFYPGSFPRGFCGYYTRQAGDSLYVGFRFDGIFGFFETGDFAVSIPVQGEIRRIILKSGQTERKIWSADAAAVPGGISGDQMPETTLPEKTAGETQPVPELPILTVIDEEVMPGAAGSSLRAVQVAVKLLDWGVYTGLDTDEIREAAAVWMENLTVDTRTEFVGKLELVDGAYQDLLSGNARELLDVAGCQDTEIFWGSDPVEPIEAIMEAAGLRG